MGLWRSPLKIAEGLGYGARLVGVPYRAGAWVREVEEEGGVLRTRLTDGRLSWSWDREVLACGYGPTWSCRASSGVRPLAIATRAGMGAPQGRVCAPALGFLRGWPTDTTRPPLTPTPLAALAEEPADAIERT